MTLLYSKRSKFSDPIREALPTRWRELGRIQVTLIPGGYAGEALVTACRLRPDWFAAVRSSRFRRPTAPSRLPLPP